MKRKPRKRKKNYPKNWKQQAWQCKEDAGWRCATCKIHHRAKRISKRTGKRYRVYLHAAHLDHDVDNPTPRLRCLCPTCHGKYDYRSRMKQQRIALEQLKHQVLLMSR